MRRILCAAFLLCVTAGCADPVPSAPTAVDTATATTIADGFATVRDVLAAELVDNGVDVAVQRFEALMASDPLLRDGCHGIAHELGSAAAMRFGVDATVAVAPGLCHGGFLHGVLQVAADDVSTAPVICTKVPDEFRADCAHGYGHLLAERFPTSIDAALEVCLAMFRPDVAFSGKSVIRCGGGAAMEYGASIARRARISAIEGVETMGPKDPVVVDLPEPQRMQPCRVLQEAAAAGLSEAHNECVFHIALFWITERTVPYATVRSYCAAGAGDRADLCEQSVSMRFAEMDMQDGLDREAVQDRGVERCAGSPDREACLTGLYVPMFTIGDPELRPLCDAAPYPAVCASAGVLAAQDRG